MDLRYAGNPSNVKLVIDTTECFMPRSTDNDVQRQMYSGKKKRHTLKYEVAVNRRYGFICWIAGSFLGPTHDLTCSKTTGLLNSEHLLHPNEKVLGDKAYVGAPRFITPIKNPIQQWQHLLNQIISAERIIVEHSIGRLKSWNCLRHTWRQDVILHSVVFHTICCITNLDMLLHPVHSQ